ncbi:MAG: membrane lipoprotein lipid attachment site-containing protein [Acutalibacteraceae bacterium]|nr:membrane lipoprotein lipid attachment site-containing protein [Acutalibacteraceae bacterium]
MKKILICLVLILALTGCSNTKSKFVGSKDTEGFSADIENFDSTDDLEQNSQLIVLGTAENLIEVSEKFGEDILYSSKVSFKVKEVLKGDKSIKDIYVLQMGKPNSDNFETKLKPNKEYILFLNSKDFNGETVYDCTGIEQGIFEINDNGKIYTYADFGISAKFDNKDKNELINKIKD